MAKKRVVSPVSIVQLQAEASKWAREYFSKHDMHLGSIPEAEFDRTAKAIVQGLVDAWGTGYMARHDRE